MNNIKVSIILPVYNVENYLAQALDSFREQTLDEFEVIMIDDGSTDSSAQIMEEYAAQDKRFRCFSQENKGVSQARNRGMGLAKGEYLAFYDSDDWIRPAVLEKMYATAKTQKADIVVGRMREFSVTGECIYAETKSLANKKEINKFDFELIWTLSLANKLFRKQFIMDYGFIFEEVAYSEDGLFLMNCVSKAEKISGCGVVAYEYRKRPLWSGRSVTQLTNERLFDDFIYAHEGMIKVMEGCLNEEIDRHIKEKDISEGAVNQLRIIKIQYIAELYYKLTASIITAFYRQLWQADDATEKNIIEKFEKYKDKVFANKLQRLMGIHRDLGLENGMKTKAQIAAEPMVTIAVTANVPKEHINMVLYSIYNQTMVLMEVLVQKDLEPYVEDTYKNCINLRFIDADCATEYKNNVLKCAKSRLINIIDEDIIYPENTLKNMYLALTENQCGFVTVPIRQADDEYAKFMKCNTVLYSGRYMNRKLPFNISLFDSILGNKLFSIEALEEAGFSFTDDVVSDIKWIYGSLKCKKRADLCIFSFFGEDYLISRVKKRLPRITYRAVRNLELFRSKKNRKKFAAKMHQKTSILGRKLRDLIQERCIVRPRVFFYSPRSNNVLLENSKFVYDALECKKVMFAKSGKHKKLENWKVKYYLFTSKVIVTDDYCDYLARVELKPQQKVVQIWHACGAFKKFGLDFLLNDRQKEKAIHGQYDVVCVSSENIRAAYAGAFGVSENQVQALGTPRTDLFYDQRATDEMESKFYAVNPELNNKKIILYCPTFRERNGRKAANNPQIDWAVFSKALPENAVMLIKNHPVVKKDLLNGEKYPNIMNTEESTNTLMVVADIMITDYSSVIFECCLLNKPVIFYCPDYDDYERDFYLDFPEDTYGDFTRDQDGLEEAVARNLERPNLENLEQFKQKYMGACDGHSTERIANMIKGFIIER